MNRFYDPSSLLRSFGLVVALLLALMPFQQGAAQNIESEVDNLANRMDDARAANLHLIAPNAFDDASSRLSAAREMLKEGEKISDIREEVQRGQAVLNRARRVQDVGSVILKDAITARNDALEAKAPEFATDRWEEAEDVMRDAGGEVEKGDQNDARDDAREAEKLYREAELTAIRSDLLGTAREQRRRARENDAEELARQTWKDAESKLQEAEQILETDRYNRARARELAEQATQQYQHAYQISRTAIRIDDDLDRNVETTVLQYEDRIRQIAEAIETDIDFGNGVDAVTNRLVAAVKSLREDRNNLQSTLAERRETIENLRGVVDSLDGRLASLEEREQTMSARLQEKRERERTLREVRSNFTSNEADVLVRGDELVIRMQGLNFPVGSSEIRPANFSLLTKLQRVIREFPDGEIVVSGHTDAQGNDASNQKLSEKRAQAVREYLLANMNVDASRMEAVGYGESEPIATNETESGREKNRRIDVTINLSTP